ncbi:MAG: transcriptional regulator [Gallionellales bacterium RIFCSPLOWO2_02_FULL_57_47]|nr:MAG: transcriptional regulator [Gallionellales bacterium RIFCSPLOWO2_02_FULL_57_47]OGT15843.1 MAG: transcriptional regulator [Gallionellales bacterium RIFCSPHIGHO2_02_FULL_57_16]
MDRLQRIYKLHQAVSSRRYPVSCQTLQDELECSRATVNRIIQEMRLYFNAPIEYDRSRNGYHYALADGKTFELPGLWFSETELYALLTTQQLLAHVQPGLLDTQLKPVKERIEQILATRHMGSEEISKRVRILRMTGRNVVLECFQTVAGALLQRNKLFINYHGRGKDETSQREISPQRLIHYRDNWYLDAYCHTRNALRSFAVERITAAKALPQRCRDIPEKQLDAHYASSYGIFAGKPKHTAVLRFTPERARWVADEHWHPQQQSQWLEDDSYELRIPYSDSRELIMDIIKHGAEVEAISPKSLRGAVMQRLKTALARYR